MAIAQGSSPLGGPGNAQPWVPKKYRGTVLKSDGVALSSSYTTDPKLLSEADWVYLQIVCVAYQIHPATVAQLAALGPVGGANAQRWTIEGPLLNRPGDPGLGNSTILVEIVHSLEADPGSSWIPYKPGHYRLRSVKARVTISMPSTAYSFALTRFAVYATRVAPPQRPRKVQSGIADVLPGGMCRVIAQDFEVQGTLDVEDDAVLEVI
jgi:hypothetical protein